MLDPFQKGSQLIYVKDRLSYGVLSTASTLYSKRLIPRQDLLRLD